MNNSPPSSTALIVIDVQRAFDEWEAAGKRRNNPDAVARIVDLLSAFRDRGAPVFAVQLYDATPDSGERHGQRSDAGRSRRFARDAGGSVDWNCAGDRADGESVIRGKCEMSSNADYFARYEAIAENRPDGGCVVGNDARHG